MLYCSKEDPNLPMVIIGYVDVKVANKRYGVPQPVFEQVKEALGTCIREVSSLLIFVAQTP